MADVAARRSAMAAAGTQVAFVHMHEESQAAEFFARYGVADLPRVADRDQGLYKAFALGTLGARDWFAPGVVRRYLGTIRAGHRPAFMGGNVRRLSGAFLVVNGEIVKAFRPRSVVEPMDLEDLSTCPADGRGAAAVAPEEDA